MTEDERNSLEAPMQQIPGRVEYVVPSDVLARDASLAEQDRERGRHAKPVGEERTDLTPYAERLRASGSVGGLRTPTEALNAAERLARRGAGMTPGEYLTHLRAFAEAQRVSLAATERMISRIEGRETVDISTELSKMKGMNHFDAIIAKLPDFVKSALINTQPRQGAVVSCSSVTFDILVANGIVGSGNGLTRTGTIVREKIVKAAEDSAF